MPLTGSVLHTAQQYPERVAIAGDGRSLSYGELVARSGRLAAAIGSLRDKSPSAPTPAAETGGIPIVAASLASAYETGRIIATLAGYRAVTATVDPRWPLAHRVRAITHAGIGVVISDSPELAPALRETGWGGRVVTLAELASYEAAADPVAAPTVRAGSEPFLLLFSSGTTSDPKMFLKTREQYRQNFAVSRAHLEPLPGVATLAPGPISYSLTLYALVECLASGGSAYLADSFDPLAVGRTISEHGITRVVAVPAMVGALAAAARRDPARFATLELVVTGGANLSAAMRDSLRAALPSVRLISYYGAAEIGFIGDSRGGNGTAIDVYDGVTARIRRADGSDIPRGGAEIGELWINAAACSDGYVAGSSGEQLRDTDGWATVHDQARWAPGGSARTIILLGRAGDIAVTAGHKVALSEVERAFDGMPGVAAACAVALPDPRRGQLVALAVEASGAVPTAAQLRAWASERLAPQFIPRRFFAVARLPRTVGGKVRRRAVAELVLRDAAAQRL